MQSYQDRLEERIHQAIEDGNEAEEHRLQALLDELLEDLKLEGIFDESSFNI